MLDLKSQYPAIQHVIDLMSVDNNLDYTASAIEVLKEGFFSPYLLNNCAEKAKQSPFVNSNCEVVTVSETLVIGEESDQKILMSSCLEFGYLGQFLFQVFSA